MPAIMTGQRLILNDGTVIEDGRAGYADGRLYLNFAGYTMQQSASMFFNDQVTQKIIFQYGEDQDEYDGFTDCIYLSIDTDGLMTVGLKRGSSNAS